MPNKSVAENYVATYYRDTDIDSVANTVTVTYGPISTYPTNLVDKSWVRTPNFVQLRKENRLPVNPFSGSRVTYSPGVLVRNWTMPGRSITRYTTAWAGKLTSASGAPIPSDLRFRVSNKLLSKAKQNEWNVPVFAAEGLKTAEMVIKGATNLVTLMRYARRGDVSSFLRHLRKKPTVSQEKRAKKRFNKDFGVDPSKAVANLWLETVYGWLPFMMDIQSAVNTVMDCVDKEEGRVLSVHSRDFYNVNTVIPDDIYEVSPPCVGTTSYSTRTDVRGKWKAVIRAADLPGRFGLTNPAAVVWELTTLSFVVDWFIPIGDYLSALDADVRFDHLGGSWGLKRESKYDYQPLKAVINPWIDTVSGRASAKATYYSREPMNSIPSPKLADLSFSANLGPIRVGSAISLLRQYFK
jgi:hypothetical protein